MRFTPASLLIGSLALVSCGYSPLYAPNGGADAAAAHLQVGAVTMIRTEKTVGARRVAQEVAQRLKLDFPQQGMEFDTLTVNIDETTSTLAVQTTSAIKRAQVELAATLTVADPNGKELLRAGVSTVAPYNVEATPYSTESGKTFARITAARNLAAEISRRLALFYHQK